MFRNLTILFIFSCTCFLLASCAKEFHGVDAHMMAAAKIVAKAINNYHSDNAEWPDTLEQTKTYIDPGTNWPTNPYNNKPLEDTGNADFDPATSVGMVYYERIFRDERQVSYMLHVFGDKDELYIIGNTAMGAKK